MYTLTDYAACILYMYTSSHVTDFIYVYFQSCIDFIYVYFQSCDRLNTVDREMFAVKKFSPLSQVAKIYRAKISRAQTARAIFARLIFAASVGGEN